VTRFKNGVTISAIAKSETSNLRRVHFFINQSPLLEAITLDLFAIKVSGRLFCPESGLNRTFLRSEKAS